MARSARLAVAYLLLAGPGPAAAVEPCTPARHVGILVSPLAPSPGDVLRVLAATDEPITATLVLTGPDGMRLAASADPRGGPPWWWLVETTASARGSHRAELVTDSGAIACATRTVGGAGTQAPPAAAWRIAGAWDRGAEALYGAWIERLFDDPLDAQPSWPRLDAVTRDPARNLLHDHLGLGEDGAGGLRLEPDCADLPYVLRAYFAWKLGRPFGWSTCTRGGHGAPPRCAGWQAATAREPAHAFFARRLPDAVHSGAARTAGDDDASDFYPIRIAPETLTPGVVYADPYGHTLVVVRRVPQTPGAAGLLLAVDAQPDGTVARKRYWRGNFLFADDPALGGAGFKRFRPVVVADGRLRTLANHELGREDFSLAQYGAGVDAFYDRVDDALSPDPLDPEVAFRAALDALDEQVRARVRSVENGERWAATSGAIAPMPDGAAIFETTGPWEDYATPARDLRLLIAIDVVRDFPARVARRADRFRLPPGATPARVRVDLERLLATEAATRTLAYARSDGSPATLRLADLLARAAALEMAYNPNDCVEVRWGAPAGSDEASTCRRRAPASQQARMARVRPWFRDRRRPSR